MAAIHLPASTSEQLRLHVQTLHVQTLLRGSTRLTRDWGTRAREAPRAWRSERSRAEGRTDEPCSDGRADGERVVRRWRPGGLNPEDQLHISLFTRGCEGEAAGAYENWLKRHKTTSGEVE